MSTLIAELDINTLAPSDISKDHLTPKWHIYQLRKGHRFSSDDIFTAYLATELQPHARTCLDLGAGIGTVGLLALSRLDNDASLYMVEAQQISHQLALKTISSNQLDHRITAIHGDLRHDINIPQTIQFDLITGSPPYFPLGKGIASPHPQRAACRMELRGSVIDYVKTAVKNLSPRGLFTVCFPSGDSRCIDAINHANLNLICEQQIVFRHDLPPTITIYAATKDTNRKAVETSPIVIRNSQGQFTSRYLDIRKRMGQPIFDSTVT